MWFSETKRFELSVEVCNLTRNTNKGYGVDSIKNYYTTSTALASTSKPTCDHPSGGIPAAGDRERPDKRSVDSTFWRAPSGTDRCTFHILVPDGL